MLNSGTSSLDVDKTIFVAPERVVYSSLRGFDIYNFKGAVIGGDWDRLEEKFEDLDIHVAFRQVFLEGKKWTKTIFYRRQVEALNRGELRWGCTNEAEFQERCRNLDRLFTAIRTRGYKSQRDLVKSERFWDPPAAEHEISVNIGRYGDLLFNDSVHRLAIAKLLHISQIPVKVAVRHPGWMLLRKELLQYAIDQGGSLYQTPTHPDLVDTPACHECENRFMMIKHKMSSKGGRLLDIGANFGYFCHKFEDEGFECYAVEDSPRELYFLRKLRRVQNRKFRVIPKSIYEWPEVTKTYFHVVLALNIFHHALKTKSDYEKLVILLRNLRMKEMFFEPPLASEPQMKSAYRNYSPSEFLEFIIQCSGFERSEVIGKAEDGRALYRLY